MLGGGEVQGGELSAARQAAGVSPTNEIGVLFCCARTRMDATTGARLRGLLQKGVDWDVLVGAAFKNGLLPLLYLNLKSCASDLVPAPVAAHLRELFLSNARRNLLLADELVNLLGLFQANAVDALPFKGPALAELVYGDPTLRQFADLDILIREADFWKAKGLLEAHGYRQEPPLTNAQTANILRHQYNVSFVRDGGRIVELHWRFTSPDFSLPVDMERLWTRLDARPLQGVIIQALRAEDLLLVLCVHGSKHLWERIVWLCDVAELINGREDMDWQYTLRQAHEFGNERILFLSLLLAHDILRATIPEEVHKLAYGDAAARSLAEQIRRRCHAGGGTPGIYESLRFLLESRANFRDKLRYCRSAVTPTERDLSLLPLPAFLSPLYYLFRPVRMLAEYSLPLLKSLTYARRGWRSGD